MAPKLRGVRLAKHRQLVSPQVRWPPPTRLAAAPRRPERTDVECASLCATSRDLIAEHEKRATNHSQLLEALCSVNRAIQRAARLRVGPPAARVVAACRAAVKQGAVGALARILRDGNGGGGGAVAG